MASWSRAMPGVDERRDQPPDVAGRADADGVAEAELAGPEVEEPLADLDHLVDRDGALPRVAEAHRDIGADVEPGRSRPGHGRLEHRELPVQAAVEVLLGEGLGGAAEDRDVPAAQLEGAVQAALVGDQHRQVPTLLAEDRHQLGGVGELGHPLRVDEAGGLDDRQPGRDQPADELCLDVGRHQRLLVLQAVARTDLVDRDPLRQPRDVIRFARHGRRFDDVTASGLAARRRCSTRNSRAPRATCSPAVASTAATVPAKGAVSASSIFIASMAPSTSPSATAWPVSTRTSSTVPGIGAVMLPSPAAAPWSAKTSGRSKTCRCPWSTTSTECAVHVDHGAAPVAVRRSSTTVWLAIGAPRSARTRSPSSDLAGAPVDRGPDGRARPGSEAGSAPSRQPSAWNGWPDVAGHASAPRRTSRRRRPGPGRRRARRRRRGRARRCRWSRRGTRRWRPAPGGSRRWWSARGSRCRRARRRAPGGRPRGPGRGRSPCRASGRTPC